MKNTVTGIVIFVLVLFAGNLFSQSTTQIALLKYKGGGDWYANPTSLPNLINFCNKNLGTNLNSDYATVEADDPVIFNYPFVHLTGHGNIVFTDEDINNIRKYLISGGFLHIDDNYGLDKFIRPQMKRVFPELDFVELPYSHPIYHQKYDFNQGLPKIHEHDNKSPKGYGLIYEGRLICFYSYESDLGDGWEDFEVHLDSEQTRLKALKMGANIIQFVFTQ
ncbi:MAG: DUF4159 domain-containing protein [Bacteroidetes bacterium]|nr:DUF4159 domain-containing protein [Bacteroidota bacterium]